MTNFPPPPQTFRDRIAYAIAAHDIASGEGLLSDKERCALNLIVVAIYRIWPTDTAQQQMLGRDGAQALRVLTRLLRDENDRRETDGKQIMHAHLIAADWQEYRGAADAALGVLIERPEAVAEIIKDGRLG